MDNAQFIGDPLEMSLDDIIRMNRSYAGSRPSSIAGSVKSFRSQRSQRNNNWKRNSLSEKFARQNLEYGKRNFARFRYYRQPRPFNVNQMFARQSVRRAARFLNMYPNRPQRMYRPYMYVRPMRPRQRMSGYIARRPMLGVFGPNVGRVQRMQGVQQRLNRVRMAESQHVNLDDAASSMLTVSVVNDFYRQPEQETLPPLIDTRTSRGKNNIGRLNQANIARHNASMETVTKRSLSPSGSIRTTMSKKSNATARRRTRRRRAQERSRAMLREDLNGAQQMQQMKLQQPTTFRQRSRLNPEIQRAIANIQNKGVDGSVRVVDENIDRPTPIATAITLNNRFTH